MARLLLDLYCGAGGAAAGYHRGGFTVMGVDICPQKNFPYSFVQADAIDYVLRFGYLYDVIHASPPCQQYSKAQRLRGYSHPGLIEVTRDALVKVGRPWIIENVPGAPLRRPIELCGSMFPQLRTYRHRWFESSKPLVAPEHPEHEAPLNKMGRPPRPGEFMHVVGNFSGAKQAREAMGIDWMTRDELRESIPPVYTEFLSLWL